MGGSEEKLVYRISSAKEWEDLQRNGSILGGHLDKSTACIHLSTLNQKETTSFSSISSDHISKCDRSSDSVVPDIKTDPVQSTLQNFFSNFPEDLYLLQIDADKLGDGLIYEAVDESNVFPHFYGPSRSFAPLPLSVVIKAEKLTVSDGKFCCSMLN
ncbi:hypothetical protein LIER_08078 [Lithospermum erythrorhizon]|uniref:Uncharacterized protein n=1 Tax=Lithospermum erythrorhizon TaxID=34254 RepID=A0AAV3PC85_LITER